MDHISLLDSTGRRKQRTPVADIQTVLRVIVQLSCRNLSALKREICEVFSRFMGGEPVTQTTTLASTRRIEQRDVTHYVSHIVAAISSSIQT